MSDFDKECEDFFNRVDNEVDSFLDAVGAGAEDANRQNGNYRNRTGHLRSSNYHKVANHELTIGNSADYASNVSSRGYDVIDSGIQYARGEVEGML